MYCSNKNLVVMCRFRWITILMKSLDEDNILFNCAFVIKVQFHTKYFNLVYFPVETFLLLLVG